MYRRTAIAGANCCAAAAILSILWSTAFAQDAASLVREAKNPFADLTNLQFLYDATLGPRNQTSQVVTLQPLVPFSVSPTWSIITRTILPLIDQPGTATGEGRTQGVGDTQFSAFLSPTRTGSLVWGVGPVLQLPTATNDALGQGKWGAGPTAGLQWSGTQWTFGALINNIWSFAGDANPTGRKPDAAAAGDQLQLQAQSEWLPYFLAHHHGELAGERQRALDGAGVSGHGSAREIGLPGDQPASERLLQCSRAPRHRCLDAGDGAAISVSEMRGTLVQFQNLIAIVKISRVLTPHSSRAQGQR